MKRSFLPGTQIEVSGIAMGCWALCGDANWGAQSEEDSIAAVRAAFDAGITFFDTAPGYGAGLSEQRLGKGLAPFRDRVVVATKVSPDQLTRQRVATSLEQSLRDLGTDYVDLLQIHWPNRQVPLEETWRALEDLKAAGKVRALGVSNFGAKDLEDVTKLGHPVVDQLPYSLLSRAVEYDVIPICQRSEVGVLCYSPLLWGLLTGKYSTPDEVPEGRARSRHFASTRPQARHTEPGCEEATFEAIAQVRALAAELGVPMSDLCMAWLLHQPMVTAVLAGIRNEAQARSNAAAGALQLSMDTLQRLDEISDPIKQALGNNPDLWQSGEASRFR